MKNTTELFASLQPKLCAYLRRLGATEQDAEDAVADAFEVLLERASASSEERINDSAFLYTVSRRNLYAIWAARSRTTMLEPASLEAVSEAVTPLEVAESPLVTLLESELSAQALRALAAPDQQVLRKVYFEGKGPREIAVDQSRVPGAVRTHLHRARSRFREQYLNAYARRNGRPGCEDRTALLCKCALDTATTRQATEMSLHLSECMDCRDLISDLRDERTSLGG